MTSVRAAEAMAIVKRDATRQAAEVDEMRAQLRALRRHAATLETRSRTDAVARENEALQACIAELRALVVARTSAWDAGEATVAAMQRERDAVVLEASTRLRALDAFLATSSSYLELCRADGGRMLTDAGAFLASLGFTAGCRPAGITHGIGGVTAACLTSKTARTDNNYVHNPGCRLLFTGPETTFHAGNTTGQHVQVDLRAEVAIAGIVTQGYQRSEASASQNGYCWFEIKCQVSATGTDDSWADVEGGRTWKRTGLRDCDVMPSVFTVPVRARFVRAVCMANSGYFRWEVVLAT
jgi:hypothetical protein